jgi:hypothetical protein
LPVQRHPMMVGMSAEHRAQLLPPEKSLRLRGPVDRANSESRLR